MTSIAAKGVDASTPCEQRASQKLQRSLDRTQLAARGEFRLERRSWWIDAVRMVACVGAAVI